MTSRRELGLPDGFVFLALLDLVSFERKNPLGIVAAFERAFGREDDATLLLKTINGRERKPRLLAALEKHIEGRDRIRLVDGHVGAGERDALLASCDCLVSLHRTEGFGLVMLEAILFGTPVVATGYGGNLQFMDEASSQLVPFDLVPVPSGEWGSTPGAMWAEPRIAAAATAMREVHDDREAARAQGLEARRRLLARYRPDVSALALAAEVTDARESHRPTS